MPKTPATPLSFINKVSASNKIPRQINRNLIFNQIRSRQPISRADLAGFRGFSEARSRSLLKNCSHERWIVEGSMGRLPRGRRPTFLNFNGQRGVLALDIHPSQTTLAVLDLGGKILSQKLIVLPEDPKRVIAAIVDAIRRMISANSDSSFDGIGMSLPGRFDLQLKNSNKDKSIFAPNVSWPIGMDQVARGSRLPACRSLWITSPMPARCLRSGSEIRTACMTWLSSMCRKALAPASLPMAGSSEGRAVWPVSLVTCRSTLMDWHVVVEAEDVGKPWPRIVPGCVITRRLPKSLRPISRACSN